MYYCGNIIKSRKTLNIYIYIYIYICIYTYTYIYINYLFITFWNAFLATYSLIASIVLILFLIERIDH